MKNFLALLKCRIGIPMVGNKCEAEILGESSSNIVLHNMVAVKIDAGKMGFAILKASNDEVIVVGILVVTLLVAELS